MKLWTLVLAVFFPLCSPGQQPPVLQGSWTATAGTKQVFRGKWSAQALPHSPNAVHGSWTLLNEGGQVILQGTWSAQKTAAAWQGSWTARTQHGRSFSGTWGSDFSQPGSRTFEQMLKRAIEKEAAGWWRGGPYRGNWWLKGLP